MGKTAGNTIRKTLVSKGLLCEYVHWLRDPQIKNLENSIRERGEKKISIPRHWFDSIRISECLKHIRPDFSDLKIISTFREPVARMISAAFENLDDTLPQLHGRDDDEAMTIISEDLNRWFRDFNPLTELTAAWFTKELKEVTGIDAYKRPFDHKKGYIRFQEFGADILIMKYERLREIFSPALSELLETKIPEPVNSNVSEQKHYAGLYKRVLNEYRLDEKTLNRIYNTPFMNHFYTPDEIEKFIRKWSEKLDKSQRLVQLAEKYITAGSIANAAQTCRKVLDADPDSVQASKLLARLFLKTGQDHLAVREYRKILSRNPYDREAVIETAKLLVKREMAENAFTLCICYLEKNPEDRQIRDLTAQIQQNCLSAAVG